MLNSLIFIVLPYAALALLLFVTPYRYFCQPPDLVGLLHPVPGAENPLLGDQSLALRHHSDAGGPLLPALSPPAR